MSSREVASWQARELGVFRSASEHWHIQGRTAALIKRPLSSSLGRRCESSGRSWLIPGHDRRGIVRDAGVFLRGSGTALLFIVNVPSVMVDLQCSRVARAC